MIYRTQEWGMTCLNSMGWTLNLWGSGDILCELYFVCYTSRSLVVFTLLLSCWLFDILFIVFFSGVVNFRYVRCWQSGEKFTHSVNFTAHLNALDKRVLARIINKANISLPCFTQKSRTKADAKITRYAILYVLLKQTNIL